MINSNKLGWIFYLCTTIIVFAVYLPPTIITVIELSKPYDLQDMTTTVLRNSLNLAQKNSTSTEDITKSTTEVVTTAYLTVGGYCFNEIAVNGKSAEDLTVNLIGVVGAGAIATKFEIYPLTDEASLVAASSLHLIPIVKKYEAGMPAAAAAAATGDVTQMNAIIGGIATEMIALMTQSFGGSLELYLNEVYIRIVNFTYIPLAEEKNYQLESSPPDPAELTLLFGFGLEKGFPLSGPVLFGVIVEELRNQLLLPYQKYWPRYIFPLCALTVAIVAIYACLAFLNRDEIEIRSKYLHFVTFLFISATGAAIGVFLYNLVAVYGDKAIYTAAVSCLFQQVCFYMFFSAINCRLWMMYLLFVKQEQRNFFFPLIWHIPLTIISAVLTFGFFAFLYDFMEYLYYVVIIFGFCFGVFLVENLALIYLTRNAWSQFCDFHLNMRLYIIFTSLIIVCYCISVTVLSPWVKVWSVLTLFTFYCNVVVLLYILDMFTLPLLKIYLRRWGFGALDDFSFVAQKELNEKNVYELLADSQLKDLLIEYATEQNCEENILFLKSISDNVLSSECQKINDDDDEQLHNSASGIEKGKNEIAEIQMEDVRYIMETFIVDGSKFEINLTHKAKQEIMSKYKKLQENQENALKGKDSSGLRSTMSLGNFADTPVSCTRAYVTKIFEKAVFEITKLVRLNLLKNFLQKEKVKAAIENRKEDFQRRGTLQVAGLLHKDNSKNGTHRSHRSHRSLNKQSSFRDFESEREDEVTIVVPADISE